MPWGRANESHAKLPLRGRRPVGYPNGRLLTDNVVSLACDAGDCLLQELAQRTGETAYLMLRQGSEAEIFAVRQQGWGIAESSRQLLDDDRKDSQARIRDRRRQLQCPQPGPRDVSAGGRSGWLFSGIGLTCDH